MQALTLQQPYASAIAHGGKRIENRSRPLFAPGTLPAWVGLHAGKAWYGRFNPKHANSRSLFTRAEHADALARLADLWRDHPPLADMPLGVLLGVMRIDWLESYARSHSLRADPWAFGLWCHHIADVRLLTTPIPCRGMLGLWPVPAEHAAALAGLVAS